MPPPRSTSSSTSTRRRSVDLRTFFRPTRRIAPNSKEVEEYETIDKSSTPRRPLYAAPPGLGELVVDVESKSDGEFVPNITHWFGAALSEPEQFLNREMSKLLSLINEYSIGMADISSNTSPLMVRLVRKLVTAEVDRFKSLEGADEQEEKWMQSSIEKWLQSPGFWAAVAALAAIIKNRSLLDQEQSRKVGWELLMIIEPVMKAESLIGIDPTVSSLLLSQERQLLHSDLWQSDIIYNLLLKEKSIRTRTRRSSLSSPGKALHAITHPVPAGVTPIEFFFRKFLRSAAAVLDQLVTALQLSEHVKQATWTLFVGAVEDEVQLGLMSRRHLLTILVSAVYSIAKLMDEDRSFAQIIPVLQRQYPLAGEDWYRVIPIDGTGVSSNLVTFYNQVYLSKMRERIYPLSKTLRTPEKKAPEVPYPRTLGCTLITRSVSLNVQASPIRAVSGTSTRRVVRRLNF